MSAVAEELAASPELFPYTLDLARDQVVFLRLSRADYERASFLDARLLTPQLARETVPWTQVAAAIDAARLPDRCGFIFHVGHVGSTLLSRLIGAHSRAFSVREPVILRTFAQFSSEPGIQPHAWPQSEFDARLTACLKLFSRTFETGQLSIVKATSFVSELAGKLLSRASSPKAVMMFVAPESYIATILGGPNSRHEARILAPSRLLRLHRRIGCEAWQLASMSEGEVLALSWACEMSALASAAAAVSASGAASAADTGASRICRIDFDRFLADPAPMLSLALRHFDLEATADDVRSIVEGPNMGRYSKAPEHAYDAALRRDVLNEARAAHGTEIRRGLTWLEQAAGRFAPLREALQFSDEARRRT